MGPNVGRARTEKRERRAFELFGQDFQLPEGPVRYGDKPDVVIDGLRKIGIEITDLYLVRGDDPNSEQVQRRHRETVLERAQALYREAGGRSIELVVEFSNINPIRKIEPLAQAVAELGQRVEQGSSQRVPRDVFTHIPELVSVYCNGREYPDAKWHTSQVYGVPSLVVPRVEEVIAEKTEKVAQYRSCDCYWLLIVVDFMNPAQDQDIRWPAGAVLTQTHAFERIWLYKPAFHEVVEVPI